MEKTIILRLDGSEYEFIKEPTLGDIVIFVALGQVKDFIEDEDKIIYVAQPLSAIVDAVPNLFEVFEDNDKEPKEIF